MNFRLKFCWVDWILTQPRKFLSNLIIFKNFQCENSKKNHLTSRISRACFFYLPFQACYDTKFYFTHCISFAHLYKIIYPNLSSFHTRISPIQAYALKKDKNKNNCAYSLNATFYYRKSENENKNFHILNAKNSQNKNYRLAIFLRITFLSIINRLIN